MLTGGFFKRNIKYNKCIISYLNQLMCSHDESFATQWQSQGSQKTYVLPAGIFDRKV